MTMTAFGSSSENVSNSKLFQSSFYVGIILENILYGEIPDGDHGKAKYPSVRIYSGIEVFLFLKTIRALWTRKEYKGSNTFYIVFNSVMLFLVTIWVATQALFGEKMWILDARFPGGPVQYWNTNISSWYMDCGVTAVILLQLMTDALMIYRCRIICNSLRAIVVPVIFWLTSFALGIMFDWASSSPGGDIFTGISAQIGFAYYTVSVVLNTTLTCMICYRMVQHAKKVQECLGREYASLYFSVIAVTVESMFPYTISGIAFLVSLGTGSSTSITFVSVYFLMMCLSPQMLILRVITGLACDNDTLRLPGSTLKFNPASAETTQSLPVVTDEKKDHLQTLSNLCLSDSEV